MRRTLYCLSFLLLGSVWSTTCHRAARPDPREAIAGETSGCSVCHDPGIDASVLTFHPDGSQEYTHYCSMCWHFKRP